MMCAITSCDARATVLVTLDRPQPEADAVAWYGHWEAVYCARHAIERPTANGLETYRDMWTLRPVDRPGRLEIHAGEWVRIP